ncbi:sigma-70 family RNA polymerase sigma factor [Blastopirellula marina]|uniref:RNA polymerase subunit sigma-70 n=1 Tax=Blastopirellula marina TaxID=124 RepID=A0A2S8FN62_9BACT|nr:sigma-70 family RNA polymerase sigma factor [Blastopirellula marina]PQO33577.1 RNA polymerase subunit sigma-70 [Blastopirellula marina]PTL43364.1 RNA polymerase subunit sigma-70 [Blastopirellula marina]
MSDDVESLLASLSEGNQAAADQLLPVLYQELKAIANQHMRNERADHTLQATALVHEAFLKLVDQNRVQWQGKAHFCAVASNIMRRILVDHARTKNAAKRGKGAQRITLEEGLVAGDPQNNVDLVELDELLTELATLNPRHAKIIEMRYFAGMTVEETAAALDVSVSTVKGDWRMAKAWLTSRFDSDSETSDG